MTMEVPVGTIPAEEKSGPIVNIITKTGIAEDRLPIYIAVSKGISKATGASIEIERRVKILPLYQDEPVLNAITTMNEDMDVPEIIEHFARLGEVRSIKLIDKNGLGMFVYLEW